jgi:NIMA (never in mitosis gene a)-related kinase 2
MIASHDFASTYVGTPFYMSPEICAAERYTLKSDIWSLGCIMYELCSREPPFNAKTHFQLVQKIKDGKLAPLPDMYSAELSGVIKDCLKVNQERRPDTAQLLNLPIVRLMRKEKEVVDLNKALKAREAAAKRKEKEADDRLAKMNEEKNMLREELDASLRREWEVKASLEINRLVTAEVERLRNKFEDEVRARVEAELQKKTVSFAAEEPKVEQYTPPLSRSETSEAAKSDIPHSSIGATSGEEFASTTDLTDYSLCDSPETAPAELTKKNARTPFGRAQTMFAGHANTPMDVEMMSPSPMAIASLSLSPRRNGGNKAPQVHTGNIFAVNAAAGKGGDARWDIPRDLGLEDSEDEDVIPSPTRQIKSSKNPFTSKTRPVLASQKTAPVGQLRSQTPGTGLMSKVGMAPPSGPAPRSPNRRLSKIPSAANLQGDAKSALKKDSSEGLSKVAAKNNIRGRTLVELQQARGQPVSHLDRGPSPENPQGPYLSPKRSNVAFRDRLARERGNSGSSSDVAMWDPETDEMPSPFLNRRRMNRTT